MHSDTDFETLWFLYKTEEYAKGISFESFCSTQGVSSELFCDWLRKRRKTTSTQTQVETSDLTSGMTGDEVRKFCVSFLEQVSAKNKMTNEALNELKELRKEK